MWSGWLDSKLLRLTSGPGWSFTIHVERSRRVYLVFLLFPPARLASSPFCFLRVLCSCFPVSSKLFLCYLATYDVHGNTLSR